MARKVSRRSARGRGRKRSSKASLKKTKGKSIAKSSGHGHNYGKKYKRHVGPNKYLQNQREATPYTREIDKRLKAKPPGKRVSRNGKIYYEYRRNRSDVPHTGI